MLDDYEFALCLTHDVDRVHKSIQCPYYALKERDLSHLKPLITSENPYWQFENIMKLENELGVRSSFYFLNEKKLIKDKKLLELLKPSKWKVYLGQYDTNNPDIKDTIKRLEKGGWEIGLHASYTTSENPERFKKEKEKIESLIDNEIIGNRQHYWRLLDEDVWENLKEIGIKYDASIGSSDKIYPSNDSYKLIRPFNDEFVVFPWSLMDGAIMNSAGNLKYIWNNCKKILEKILKENGVIVIDWHQRVFYNHDFPNWKKIYMKLIKKALKMGAWIGPPRKLYESLSHPNGTIKQALREI